MANLERECFRPNTACCREMTAVLLVFSCAAGAAPGCWGPTRNEERNVSGPVGFSGIIDTSLAGEERERREVVRRLLLGLVGGEDFALIQKWLPGVEFRESQAAFFNGNVLLRRWDFTPSPPPGAITVTLEFVPADDSLATRIEQRTYEVTGRSGAWVVDRIAAERLPP